MKKIIMLVLCGLFLVGCQQNKKVPKPEVETPVDVMNLIKEKYDSITPYDVARKKWTNTTTDNIKIAIYMYHNVNFTSDYSDGNSIPYEKLEQHFAYFKENGYTTITLDDYYAYVKEGLAIPAKSIIITFDDGYKSMVQVNDLLLKYDLFATTFLIGEKTDVDTTYHLTSTEINDLKESGHMFFGSHTTKMHKQGSNGKGLIQTIDFSEGVADINSQDSIINSQTVCYPFGHYNQQAKDIVEASGKKLAVTTKNGFVDKTSDLFALNRIRVSANTQYPELP